MYLKLVRMAVENGYVWMYNVCEVRSMIQIPADFRGCALWRDETGVRTWAQGYADWSGDRLNALDTKFGTASAGKAFVAVGVLQLVEKRLLRLDSTIGKVLDIDWKAIDRAITVEQLLTHTSGIPDYFDESVMDEYEELWVDFPNYRVRRNADLLPLFINKPMMYPRGEKFQYNNTGFVVLAMMIEAVTGMAFDDYLQANVFRVAGMTGTGYYAMDMLPKNCAMAYIWDEKRGGYRTNIYSVDAKGTGAGGAFTTVSDIEKFWDALMGHRLLSAGMTEKMITLHTQDESSQYGYGVWLKNGGAQVQFEGCDPGVSFITRYDRDTGRMFAIASNYGDDVWKIAQSAGF